MNIDCLKQLLEELAQKPLDEQVQTMNLMRKLIHDSGPFKHEPVDYVKWVRNDELKANDYNPNRVAPPEMELLKVSILNDGYTQPIVSWPKDAGYEVVDGFHRNRVGKECEEVREKVKGYLPITVINAEREDRGDRIASTIRHNRARGKHVVEGMSDIVLELKNRNWKNERIARELGMELDEILRLCQITGLEGLFSDQDFSKSWDIEDAEIVDEFVPISDDVDEIAVVAEENKFRSANTNDKNRIFHTWDKWECYKAGFYNTSMNGTKKEDAEMMYADFLSDTQQFADSLEHIITEWKHSCEHYLTNSALNRIAWLGQAAACYAKGLPATYRGGFNLLSNEEQITANETALIYLNKWLEQHGRAIVTMEDGLSGLQVDLY